MWVFVAVYDNMNLDPDSEVKQVRRKIEFEEDCIYERPTRQNCYRYAMNVALSMMKEDECLVNLEFICC